MENDKNNNYNLSKIKYSRNTDFKKLDPLKMNKTDKFHFENEASGKNENQSMLLNSNVNSNYHNNNNFEYLNSLTNSNSNKTTNMDRNYKPIDFDSKLDLKNKFDLLYRKINRENENNINGNNKNNILIEDFIPEKNRTLKSLEILNYGGIKTEYENISSTVLGVNMLSLNQLSLKDIKNHLKENIINSKNMDNIYNPNSNNKAKCNSLANKINKKTNKRRNSFSSLDKLEDPQSKLLKIFSKSENEIARINASYEVKSPRKKFSIIDLDFININDYKNTKRINKNNLFDKALKSCSLENTKSKNISLKLSNNNMHENFFLHTNSNIDSSNKIISYQMNTNSSINNNYNHDEKKFAAKLKSQNNLFLKTEKENNSPNKISSEKLKDLDFNFILSSNFNIIERSNNNTLLTSHECSNKKPLLFDENKAFGSNTINNDLAKKISSYSNISYQSKIKLNEINLLTERLKALGEKDKKSDLDLFKNKKLFTEVKKSNSEEAIHRSILIKNSFINIF